MRDDLRADIVGNQIVLNRDQWKGTSATISNYPGLLEHIREYTWTYQNSYLRSSKLNKSLHWFVLAFLYTAEKLDVMLAHSSIIEHLDNNGLNCCYENLHILPADNNKAKAFTIDKAPEQVLPSYITDVYYNHEKNHYQMQIMFNDNMYFRTETGVPIEMFFAHYCCFNDLFIDWLYVINSNGERFVVNKFHCTRLYAKDRPVFQIKPEEEDNTVIERDGKLYLRLSTNPERFSCMLKTSYREVEK